MFFCAGVITIHSLTAHTRQYEFDCSYVGSIFDYHKMIFRIQSNGICHDYNLYTNFFVYYAGRFAFHHSLCTYFFADYADRFDFHHSLCNDFLSYYAGRFDFRHSLYTYFFVDYADILTLRHTQHTDFAVVHAGSRYKQQNCY